MANSARVVIVEDNEDTRLAVVKFLRQQGYRVHDFATSESAQAHLKENECDIILADISFARLIRIEMTSALRALGHDEPIIAITARDTIDDKVLGLAKGMNDYIVKPFDLRELEARITAQLRSRDVHHGLSNITTSSFFISPKQHAFSQHNKPVKLTVVEFRIMLKLMQHNHTTVTTQDLIESAWGEEAALSNPPIRIHISNIRSKINDKDLQIIQTIPGVGYMLND